MSTQQMHRKIRVSSAFAREVADKLAAAKIPDFGQLEIRLSDYFVLSGPNGLQFRFSCEHLGWHFYLMCDHNLVARWTYYEANEDDPFAGCGENGQGTTLVPGPADVDTLVELMLSTVRRWL